MGKKEIHKINFLFLLISLLLFACVTQPSDTNPCGSGYQKIDDKCYSDIDIGVLQQIIDSSLFYNKPIDLTLDINSNDTIEPLELSQKWNDLGRLTSLWLYDVSLGGNLPENIGDLKYLDTLNLSYNNLSGDIPLSIGGLENLKWLYLKLNNFSGTIPDTVCAIYSNLKNVSFAYNNFCSPYPDCIPIEKIGAQDTTNCITN